MEGRRDSSKLHSIYCIGKLKRKNPGQQVSVTWSSRNPKVEFPYNKRQVHVLSRDCSLLPVTPLRRSQGKCSSSLSCCAPRVNSANMAQLSLQELTATSLLPCRGYNCIILKVFHQCLHCTLVSIRGTPAAQVCLGIGVRYSQTATTRRGATQQGAGSGGMPFAVPPWRPGAN